VNRVLLSIPGTPIQIFGFGVMLALAMWLGTESAARRYAKLGGKKETIYDLALFLLIGGVVGARLFYVIQFWNNFQNFWQIFEIWRGGMVFYGSFIGGLVGFLAFTTMKGLKRLELLDCVAPSLALGLALGRVGCFLNGCCYGDVCTQPWGVAFPFGSDGNNRFATLGVQSLFGFQLVDDPARKLGLPVGWIEPGTDAERQGLRPGDTIVDVNGSGNARAAELGDRLFEVVRRYDGKGPTPVVHLEVERAGKVEKIAFRLPRSPPLHPTQLYSAVGALLLYFLLATRFALRRRDGEVVALLLVAYPVGRFLVEILRSDEKFMWDGLTISQNLSIPVFVAGLAVTAWVSRRPPLASAPVPIPTT
jgi:phosphatidylglycerol:prolipoprotein diacylglycerol transferase